MLYTSFLALYRKQGDDVMCLLAVSTRCIIHYGKYKGRGVTIP